MKTNKIFWWSLLILWTPFEAIQLFFTKELSQIAIFLRDKIFD